MTVLEITMGISEMLKPLLKENCDCIALKVLDVNTGKARIGFELKDGATVEDLRSLNLNGLSLDFPSSVQQLPQQMPQQMPQQPGQQMPQQPAIPRVESEYSQMQGVQTTGLGQPVQTLFGPTANASQTAPQMQRTAQTQPTQGAFQAPSQQPPVAAGLNPQPPRAPQPPQGDGATTYSVSATSTSVSVATATSISTANSTMATAGTIAAASIWLPTTT